MEYVVIENYGIQVDLYVTGLSREEVGTGYNLTDEKLPVHPFPIGHVTYDNGEWRGLSYAQQTLNREAVRNLPGKGNVSAGFETKEAGIKFVQDEFEKVLLTKK